MIKLDEMPKQICDRCKIEVTFTNPCDCTEPSFSNCNGFIGLPGRLYGYAGKWCQCDNRTPVYPEKSPPIIIKKLGKLNG